SPIEIESDPRGGWGSKGWDPQEVCWRVRRHGSFWASSGRRAPTLVNEWTAPVPVGHLLEGVAGPKNQRLSHMSTNNLESDWKTIGCFTAGQCQRRMAAHIKRCSEADPGFTCCRSAPSGSHGVRQGRRRDVHHRHDQEVNITEESIEPAAKSLAPKQDLGHRKAIEGAAGFQQCGQQRAVLGAARWVSRFMRNGGLDAAKSSRMTHNCIGRGKADLAQHGADARQHRSRLLARAYHVNVSASSD